jgi:hypothetical protein
MSPSITPYDVGGLPTVLTIMGNRVAPGLLHAFLARSNVEAQQNADKGPPRDAVNLWEPVPGDHGARGEFDDTAFGRSPQAFVTRHRSGAAVAALLSVGAGVAARGAARRRSRRWTPPRCPGTPGVAAECQATPPAQPRRDPL